VKFKEVVIQEGGSLSSDNFIKLSDRQTVQGIFRGEPYDFRQHWLGNRSVVCSGADCPECAKGDRPKFRFRINFIGKTGNEYSAKIFEHGARFYNTLKQLHESGYDLEKTVVNVTRNGMDTQTTYTILPVPNVKVDDLVEKKLQAIKLHDLSSFKKSENESGPGDFDNIPF
jgi:hypothetical protein